MTLPLSLILEAAHRLKPVIYQTPLQFCKRLSQKYDCQIYLKREDLQEVRSFKIRGAYNKIASLTKKDQQKGIVTVSSGNHAQGVALSCKLLKINGTIYMPTTTPKQKIVKVQSFGQNYITIKLIGNSFDDTKTKSLAFSQKNSLPFIHPFDDELVIAGQGTVAVEIDLQLNQPLDYVLAAIGGGGLVSGIGAYFKNQHPNTKVIGIESATQASMQLSLKKGHVTTLEKLDSFCDGTAVNRVGDKTYHLAKKTVADVIVVQDGAVATNMIELYQQEGIIAEPSGAMAVTGLEQYASKLRGKTVVCVVCGGNNDLLKYPEIMERSVIYQGRKHYFVINFTQKPGQLKHLVTKVLGPTDDIVRFEYLKKTNANKGPAFIGIELEKKQDLQPLLKKIKQSGLEYQKINTNDLLYKYLV